MGKGDDEFGACSRTAFGGDASAVPFDDLSANREPYAGALVLSTAVKALEYLEDPVQVLLVKSDSVVLDRNPADAGGLLPAVDALLEYSDGGRHVRLVKL